MPESLYRDRVRVRVNGLLVEDDRLLLVKILSPVTKNHVWIPPGGGLEFGETMEQCLVREYREETGLRIEVGTLRHINELVQPPYHAVEFYFSVTRTGGVLKLGNDPEQSAGDQILENIQFQPLSALASLPLAPDYLNTQFVEDIGPGSGGVSYAPDCE